MHIGLSAAICLFLLFTLASISFPHLRRCRHTKPRYMYLYLSSLIYDVSFLRSVYIYIYIVQLCIISQTPKHTLLGDVPNLNFKF